MSHGRSLMVVVLVVVAVEVVAFISQPQLHALFARQHWIFYAYVGAMAGSATYAAVWLLSRLPGALRPDHDD